MFDFFKKFEVDTLFADFDNLDFYGVAYRENFVNGVDSLIAHLGNMNHTVFSGSEFAECADLRKYSYNRRNKHIADFGVSRYRHNHRFGFFRHREVFAVGRYANLTVIVDVDLNARLVDNLVNSLSAAADDVFDFIGVDIERNNLGSVLGKIRVRSGNTLEHFTEYEMSALVSLLDRLSQNFFADTLNLYIHLDSRDTLSGTRYLEVHIAEEVL